MLIVSGTASTAFGKALSSEMGCAPAETEIIRFPDGECYVRIETPLEGEDVVLVQNTYPDGNLVENLLLQDAIAEGKPASFTVVIPYFGYSRQDKAFKPGEGISSRVLGASLSRLPDRVVTVDIHTTTIFKWFGGKGVNVSAMPVLGKHLAGKGVDLILSPDKGSIDRATLAAETAGVAFDYFEKTRLSGSEVKIADKPLDVEGKTVAIADDIIATGGTMIRAAEQLREKGAAKVLAACTHGLYTSSALERLKPVFDEVISTDTLPSETSTISSAPAVAELLKR